MPLKEPRVPKYKPEKRREPKISTDLEHTDCIIKFSRFDISEKIKIIKLLMEKPSYETTKCHELRKFIAYCFESRGSFFEHLGSILSLGRSELNRILVQPIDDLLSEHPNTESSKYVREFLLAIRLTITTQYEKLNGKPFQ